MSVPKTIAELRSLVAAWTPPDRRTGNGLRTGVPAIDATLGGGLPAGQLTELVGASGAGGQLVLAQLLAETRAARQRVALIDATDSFAPEAVSPDDLRHLVWARCRNLTEALAVADVLVRDGNYSAIMLDLRDVPLGVLHRTPKTLWHRLHRVAERQMAAVVVFSRRGVVPAVRWRLQLERTGDWTALRSQLLDNLHVEANRGYFAQEKTA